MNTSESAQTLHSESPSNCEICLHLPSKLETQTASAAKHFFVHCLLPVSANFGILSKKFPPNLGKIHFNYQLIAKANYQESDAYFVRAGTRKAGAYYGISTLIPSPTSRPTSRRSTWAKIKERRAVSSPYCPTPLVRTSQSRRESAG